MNDQRHRPSDQPPPTSSSADLPRGVDGAGGGEADVVLTSTDLTASDLPERDERWSHTQERWPDYSGDRLLDGPEQDLFGRGIL